MIANIVIPIIILAVTVLAFALCKTASNYDDIAEEYWSEYQEEKEDK